MSLLSSLPHLHIARQVFSAYSPLPTHTHTRARAHTHTHTPLSSASSSLFASGLFHSSPLQDIHVLFPSQGGEMPSSSGLPVASLTARMPLSILQWGYCSIFLAKAAFSLFLGFLRWLQTKTEILPELCDKHK